MKKLILILSIGLLTIFGTPQLLGIKTPQDVLWEGIEHNDLNLVKSALAAKENKPDVNAVKDGSLPLQIAIKNENKDIVAALIQAGADVNKWISKCGTLLYLALSWASGKYWAKLPSEKIEIIDMLLKAGANPNTFKPEWKTGIGDRCSPAVAPLVAAIRTGNKDIVKSLIKAGADVNEYFGPEFGTTPLKNAIDVVLRFGGPIEMIKILLDAGADINKEVILSGSEFPISPLNEAVISGSPIQFGPPRLAAEAQYLETLKLLLERGAKVTENTWKVFQHALDQRQQAWQWALEKGILQGKDELMTKVKQLLQDAEAKQKGASESSTEKH